ncbi:hypothetical protein [Uliginosibacterium sediminicola]|uniref:MxaK protein n=1 Tax=Uliginosibacterium sediminicola TaxID=2024550 RepID=A0ABU9YTY9_9RHOO
MKIAIRIVIFFAVLAIGMALGVALIFNRMLERERAFDGMELEYYTSFESLLMRKGTEATQEATLRAHLALMEKRQDHAGFLLKSNQSNLLASDAALSYARLSNLAARRNANDEAKQLLDKAVSYCPQMGWVECNATQITRAVDELKQIDASSFVLQAR